VADAGKSYRHIKRFEAKYRTAFGLCHLLEVVLVEEIE
jgi:hypothetical protein